jgi:hypothetical protein
MIKLNKISIILIFYLWIFFKKKNLSTKLREIFKITNKIIINKYKIYSLIKHIIYKLLYLIIFFYSYQIYDKK